MAFLEPHLLQQMTLWTVTCFLVVFLPVALSSQPCSSNEIATGGARCCHPCAPGTGVSLHCNATSGTKCEPCVLNQSYSPSMSHEHACLPCTKCTENSQMLQPCNTTGDAICECLQNYFWNVEQRRCDPCDLCRVGEGAWVECSPVQNTRCRLCALGMFSESRGLGACRPCMVCGEDQLLLQRCSPTENTICMDITPQKPTVMSLFPKTVSTLSHNTTESGKSDILPVYCAFLAGLVVGLVAYVIVLQVRRSRARRTKCSYTCSSGGVREGARLAPGGSTPQIPTQGSDSGVFVDNDVKTVAVSPSFRIRDLPPPLKRVLETSIHAMPDNRGGWRSLARQLGYNSSRTSAFLTRATRDDTLPARYLLSDWSKKSHATVGGLQVALHKIGRHDITIMFQSDLIPPQPNHRRSRESIAGALGRSDSTNQDNRSKSIGLNNMERQPDGAADPESISPGMRNNRRSMVLSVTGSQRLVNI